MAERRLRFLLALALIYPGSRCIAQIETAPHSTQGPDQNQAPPRSERDKEAGESSSSDTRIDLSAPANDAKSHPASSTLPVDPNAEVSDGVQEMHPWNPYKAAKDIEVGDFYYKKKNYRAALDRYREALVWKDNDAVANFRMAECLEKLHNPSEAAVHYQEYLRILPHGALAGDARKALQRLNVPEEKNQASAAPAAK
ncbi:MAG: hypothetical protein JOY93_05200 [Acidobacteriales bacterium]|nr:hypothetical protein [Terriglobales bacterium]